MRNAPPIVPGMPRRNDRPGDARLGGRARHLHVGRAGAGPDAMARLDRDVGEALAEANHDACPAAVADRAGSSRGRRREPACPDRGAAENTRDLAHRPARTAPAPGRPCETTTAALSAHSPRACRAAPASPTCRGGDVREHQAAFSRQRVELSRQRIGPLGDVAGAEADHVIARFGEPLTRPARSSDFSSAIALRWPRALRPATRPSRSAPGIGCSPAA